MAKWATSKSRKLIATNYSLSLLILKNTILRLSAKKLAKFSPTLGPIINAHKKHVKESRGDFSWNPAYSPNSLKQEFGVSKAFPTG